MIISIHALTRSATLGPTTYVFNSYDFNPRTHEECDLWNVYFANKEIISIHALTRSATHGSITTSPGSVFQSTHSRGVRRNSR